MFKKKNKASKNSSSGGSGNQGQSQAGPSHSGHSGQDHLDPQQPQPAPSFEGPPEPSPAHPHASRPGSTHSGSSHKSNISFKNPETLGINTEIPEYDPYKYSIGTWPERSDCHENVGNIGKIIPHRYIGPHAPNPDMRIHQDPLDWKTVRKMNHADRKKLIVARANFFTQVTPWLLRMPSYMVLDSWIKDAALAKEGGFSMEKPLHPLRVDTEQIAKEIELASGMVELDKHSRNNRMNDFCTFSTMRGTMQIFKEDPVCQKLMLFLSQNLPRTGKTHFTKMVAFGAWAMSLAKPEKTIVPGADRWFPEHIPQRMQVQNAALLAIHKHLELLYNKDIPLYLQDPNYVEADQKALHLLKHPRATIVNGDFGFQQGFVEIDEETFFCDFSMLKNGFYRQIFEYTRPGAILALAHYQADPENDWEKGPWKYTFENQYLLEEGQHVVYHWPGLGIKNYSAGILEVLDGEYDHKIMDQFTQQRFLGNPVLYLRKSEEQTPPRSSGSAH